MPHINVKELLSTDTKMTYTVTSHVIVSETEVALQLMDWYEALRKHTISEVLDALTYEISFDGAYTIWTLTL